jgi:ABC-2 type transport system permease protein/oleandomycin transport system permease protein
MTATQHTPATRTRPFRDGLAMTWRNLLVLRRSRQLLVLATIQPVLFVLMFRYVFGGSLASPGVDYVDFLMPGIFVQAVVFGAATTAIGISQDIHSGMVERLRSLPMARSAVLAGRTAADLVRNTGVVALMVAIGLAVGFRIHDGLLPFIAGMGIVLLLSFALSWVFAYVGLVARSAETAQAAAFPLFIPLVFASSAFVQVDTMPGWLQGWAANQPVTATIDAVRGLTLGTADRGDVLAAVAWNLGLVAVFASLAVRRYRAL